MIIVTYAISTLTGMIHFILFSRELNNSCVLVEYILGAPRICFRSDEAFLKDHQPRGHFPFPEIHWGIEIWCLSSLSSCFLHMGHVSPPSEDFLAVFKGF